MDERMRRERRANQGVGPYGEQQGTGGPSGIPPFSDQGPQAGASVAEAYLQAMRDALGILAEPRGEGVNPTRNAGEERTIQGVGAAGTMANGGDAYTPWGEDGDVGPRPVDEERLREFDRILEKYKSGKKQLERRVISAEQWWKLRNTAEEIKDGAIEESNGFRAKTGWLHNVIVAKHADAMENYPEAMILPREPGDRQQAKILSSVLPAIMEQCHFEKTYDAAMWQKLKTGTGIYQVIWDPDAAGGLGDISIRKVDVLQLFWEPGVNDIQKSRYLFYVEIADNEALEEAYPQLRGKLKGMKQTVSRYYYDDTVPTDGKSAVIDVYYKRQGVLHYCKYVGDQVLFATENGDGGTRAAGGVGPYGMDAGMAGPQGKGGLYDHGKYPFVFDPLWPIEGSPCGYGYVDLCQNPQTQIDMMDTAFMRNTLVGATPRYFQRADGGVNESELLDLRKPIVHVTGTLDETALRVVDHQRLDGAYINVYQQKISELRETSGNTESANGVSSAGVTAASAIAALQEASGKTSRDSTQASYRSFSEIVELCIELIRQFYTLPRTYRIIGEQGQESFKQVSNAPMQPQMVSVAGVNMGWETPLYDIKIKAQRRNAYSRTAQNELALQLYQLGFFQPQMATPALSCLDMMDFEGKEDVVQKVMLNGTLQQQLEQAQMLAMSLVQRYEPQNAPQAAAMLGMGGAPGMPMGAAQGGQAAPEIDDGTRKEHPLVEKARERANRTTEADT